MRALSIRTDAFWTARDSSSSVSYCPGRSTDQSRSPLFLTRQVLTGVHLVGVGFEQTRPFLELGNQRNLHALRLRSDPVSVFACEAHGKFQPVSESSNASVSSCPRKSTDRWHPPSLYNQHRSDADDRLNQVRRASYWEAQGPESLHRSQSRHRMLHPFGSID
jgi:hypothetical protein